MSTILDLCLFQINRRRFVLGTNLESCEVPPTIDLLCLLGDPYFFFSFADCYVAAYEKADVLCASEWICYCGGATLTVVKVIPLSVSLLYSLPLKLKSDADELALSSMLLIELRPVR